MYQETLRGGLILLSEEEQGPENCPRGKQLQKVRAGNPALHSARERSLLSSAPSFLPGTAVF